MGKYKVNKQRRIIYTNDIDIDEEMATGDYEDEDDVYFSNETWLSDERCNLNIDVDGVIVAFACLGLWDGTHKGAKTIGTNVNDILHSKCDIVTWYCDPYNVKCDAIHHDGSNFILYRVAKDMQTAKRLVNEIAYGDMSEKQFRKATRSLRPYVAKVYGW